MSKRYKISRIAQQQLDDIFQYSDNAWGRDQADTYIGDLFRAFQDIADGKSIGRQIQAEYGVDGRFVRCARHYIFWRRGENGTVNIAEILHERMNIGDHLAKSQSLNYPAD